MVASHRRTGRSPVWCRGAGGGPARACRTPPRPARPHHPWTPPRPGRMCCRARVGWITPEPPRRWRPGASTGGGSPGPRGDAADSGDRGAGGRHPGTASPAPQSGQSGGGSRQRDRRGGVPAADGGDVPDEVAARHEHRRWRSRAVTGLAALRWGAAVGAPRRRRQPVRPCRAREPAGSRRSRLGQRRSGVSVGGGGREPAPGWPLWGAGGAAPGGDPAHSCRARVGWIALGRLGGGDRAVAAVAGVGKFPESCPVRGRRFGSASSWSPVIGDVCRIKRLTRGDVVRVDRLLAGLPACNLHCFG
ncbi:hypothetical protein HNP84_009968 [Thermocatellispora tengchongensis]|uniref:Uncharacterized protein n=1 Tax=Thermocatellispora tengchongensis TaxID=1073253 RepID=A0A840PR07_9ACTN|nr:hypothetical protein [Thermocatellispora tengchongensis]